MREELLALFAGLDETVLERLEEGSRRHAARRAHEMADAAALLRELGIARACLGGVASPARGARWLTTPSPPITRASSSAAPSTRTCTSRPTSRRAGSPTSSWPGAASSSGSPASGSSRTTRPRPSARRSSREAVPGVRALGTITLNHAVGGLNATAVEVAARQGARIVWLPDCRARRTSSARSSTPTRTARSRSGCASSWTCGPPGVRPRAVPVVDGDGDAVAGAARRPRRRGAARPRAGHRPPRRATRSSPSSTPPSTPACKTIVITHPEFPSQRISPRDQQDLAGAAR